MSPPPRFPFAYWLGNNRLYLSVTRQHAVQPDKPFATLFHARGPKFSLPNLPTDYEPSAQEMFDAVEDAYTNDDRKVSAGALGMGEADEGIVFAGTGEPLLRLDRVLEAAQLIKEARHGVPLRLSSTGLGSRKDAGPTTSQLFESGIEHLSLFVYSADTKEYAAHMGGFGLSEACNFSVLASEQGMQVRWVTVAYPASNPGAVRTLAAACGAVDCVIKPFAG
jgi:hypothetical protein